jgi:hypothetical protein
MIMIQVDISGHPPSPTGPKHVSGNFGNLLFLAVFNFRGHFEALNDVFWENGEEYGSYINVSPAKICSSRIDISNELSYA